nr:uncharacterized protein LOC121468376 [Taeniopygia guttata]XP_041567826.1 uncharacterized protein LOC121468376 [Taeniopygia guttata]
MGGYKVSKEKAQIAQQTVIYLVCEISQGQRKLGTNPIQAICAIPEPQNLHELRVFLGMTGWCSLWIMDYGLIAKPLYEAQKTQPFTWGKPQKEAFLKLKEALTTAPALGLPDLSKDFQLFVHERMHLALGVLTQRLGSWKRPVGYFSKQLDNVSTGWPSCLQAVTVTVILIQEARKLTMGRHIDVYVPHMVTTVLEQKGAHWLSPSRMMKFQPKYSAEDEKLGHLLNAQKNPEGWYVTAHRQIVVPPLVMREVLQIKHNKCHWGVEALVKFLKCYLVSVRILTIAKSIMSKCEICLKNNPVARRQAQLGRVQVGIEPGDYWQVDFVELPRTRGYKYLLVGVDTFSGWPEALPCRTNQAKETVKWLLEEIIPRFGVPLGISSDRRPHFIAMVVKEVSRLLGITWDLHTPWRPQSSGQVERMNQTLKRQISKICQEAKLQRPQALPIALLHPHPKCNCRCRI